MIVALRSAFLVIAALTASSVAPAQVNPNAEPLIAEGSDQLPVATAPVPLPVEEAVDPLAQDSEPQEEELEVGATLAETVANLRSSDPGSRELECLAAGIYFESKSEPLNGQLAVGQVIANRAQSGRFASTYCGVLFQRGQFSFVRGKSWPRINTSSRQWRTAVAIAKIVEQELHESAYPRALFFHAKRVNPRWRLKRVGSVGNHIFYR